MGRRLVGAALAAAVVLVGGCGDDDGAAPDATATTAVPATPAGEGGGEGAEEGAAGDAVVDVVGFEFQPSALEVAAGSTVTWTNGDGVPHTVTAGSPGSVGDAFHEALDPGGSATITFDEAGTFAYHCSLHPGMLGEVVAS